MNDETNDKDKDMSREFPDGPVFRTSRFHGNYDPACQALCWKQQDLFTDITAALFIIVKRWKQSQCPPMEEWIR